VLDPWDVVGDAEMTEYWRSVIPALSVDSGDDQTDVANDRRRVASVRQLYALDLKHLTQTQRSRGFVTSSLTRISDWSQLTPEERHTSRPNSPFVLCRGVPSGLSSADRSSDDGLDFALLVSVPPPFLPAGPLFLDGVPVVVHGHRPIRPLPTNADALWPRERPIPSYVCSPRLVQRGFLRGHLQIGPLVDGHVRGIVGIDG
jgi:hypothetical protein